MIHRLLAVSFVSFASLLFSVSSGEVSYQSHQVWRVIPASEQVLDAVRFVGDKFKLDFWKDPTKIGRAVDFRVAPWQTNDVAKSLRGHGIMEFEVYIQDVQDLINRQKTPTDKNARVYGRAAARNVANFDYNVYHTADEVYEWMDMVVKEYPEVVSKVQIGVTHEGRKIFALEFKKFSVNAKPTIFLDALIHCREWITVSSLMFIFKEMLRNPAYSHMLEDADWHFIPMINIDGYVETWTGDRLWRKTRTTGPSSICSGVDGNRNWDAFWSLPGSSPDPCSIFYHGPTAFSESELRHLASYAMKFKGRIDAYVATHSYSQLILYAYHYSVEPTADDAELNITGKLMSEAIRKVHGKEYVYGPGSTTLYTSAGTTTDWTYEVLGVKLSYLYELRDTGEYGFLLPPEQIIPTGEEYIAGLAALKEYVVEHFDGGSGMQ